MSFRLVNFKKPDGSLTGAVPEINGLGLIKVKDTTGNIQNVTSLYINDGTANPKLIWEPTTVSASTNEPTQPPAGPCDNQPVCPNAQYEAVLHYPLIPNTTERWDCAKWKITGNAVDLSLNTTISNSTALLDPEGTGQYAKVYNFNSAPPLPPPPGYILLDYLSFSVADRIAVYINKNIEASATNFHALTNSDPTTINVLFPSRNGPFDNSNGKNSDKIYSLAGCSCDAAGTNCTWNNGFGTMPLCELDPAGFFPVCACTGVGCADGCFCDGVPEPQQGGGPPPECKTLDQLDTGFTNFIIDTSCTATSEGCKTVCYGRPAQEVAGDATPSGSYVCRYVGKVPNIVTGSYTYSGSFDQFNASFAYQNAYRLKDFAIVNNAGCRSEDCPSQPLPCPSAWKTKIFLPFYVNLPDARYPTGTGATSGALTDASSSLNLKGKYIEITKQVLNSVDVISEYNSHPILKTVQNLLLGNIRSCSAILSFPWDQDIGQTSTNVTFWALTEYPRQISAGNPSHTHQLVVEVGNPADTCGLCLNPSNSEAINKISYIRFYPITDGAGNLFPIFSNFAASLNSATGTPTSGPQSAIFSIRQQYHPVQGSTASGELYYNNTNIFTTPNNSTAAAAVYKDTYTGGAAICQTYNGLVVTNASNQLTLQNILTKIQQSPINANSITPVDCQCTQI